MVIKGKSTSIRVSVKLRNKLESFGRKGQTYEDLIWDLLLFKKKGG